MKLVVGLGNQENKYKKTRHNVGFILMDELAKEISPRDWSKVNKFESSAIYLPAIGGDRHSALCIAKPQTSMNLSGDAVSKLVNYFNIENDDLWVVHDDLDIKLGEYKIQKGIGPKVHNGLNSIYEKLGYKDFWHVRIGIDNRGERTKVGNKLNVISGQDYVLQNFTDEEFDLIKQVVDKIISEIKKNLFKEDW